MNRPSRLCRLRRIGGRVLGAVVATVLAACADAPRAPGAPPAALPRVAVEPAAAPDDGVPSAPPESLMAFERGQRDAAEAAMRQGRYADAVWAWDIVLALRPNDADAARRRARADDAARAALPERLARARAARQRGELDPAARAYLDVLGLDPNHAQAADALREIERERVRRYQLGQPSRVVMARRSPVDAAAPAAGPDERNALEHASMLAHQGEVDAAIAVLQPLVGPRKGHPTLRALLSDLHLRRAERLAAPDRAGAITALERSLQADPGNGQAAQRLKQLRDADVPKPTR